MRLSAVSGARELQKAGADYHTAFQYLSETSNQNARSRGSSGGLSGFRKLRLIFFGLIALGMIFYNGSQPVPPREALTRLNLASASREISYDSASKASLRFKSGNDYIAETVSLKTDVAEQIMGKIKKSTPYLDCLVYQQKFNLNQLRGRPKIGYDIYELRTNGELLVTYTKTAEENLRIFRSSRIVSRVLLVIIPLGLIWSFIRRRI